MNSILNSQSLNFKYLLYTEWAMLGSCGVMAAIEAWQNQQIPVIHILILLTLGLMEFALPKVTPSLSYIYIALQMGLIFLGTTLGYLHILPTLYLIVMIRSCFLFQLPGRWVVALLSFLLFSGHQVQYLTTIMPLKLTTVESQRILMHQFAEFLMFGLSLFLVAQLVNTLILERTTQEKLTSANNQLRQYSLQIEDLAAVQERNRIAREIHDSLGHALTSLNVQLQTGLKLWQRNPQEAKPFLEQAQRLGTVAMKEVRQSVSALRADEQTEIPLPEAIDSLLKEFQQSTGLTAESRFQLTKVLPQPMGRTVYRLIQEALTNIYKHARATKVQVEIRTDPEQIYLSVTDNGRGFTYHQVNSGYGLQGMRERVEAIDGDFQLESSPGNGCHIVIIIPFRENFDDSSINRG
jgi:signal transduction histidine kinase